MTLDPRRRPVNRAQDDAAFNALLARIDRTCDAAMAVREPGDEAERLLRELDQLSVDVELIQAVSDDPALPLEERRAAVAALIAPYLDERGPAWLAQ